VRSTRESVLCIASEKIIAIGHKRAKKSRHSRAQLLGLVSNTGSRVGRQMHLRGPLCAVVVPVSEQKCTRGAMNLDSRIPTRVHLACKTEATNMFEWCRIPGHSVADL
jgi:hypothetical protein